MVVCHPGTSEVAKSILTTECTESTSGVEIPASTRETSSKRCQFFALPTHPKLKIVYQKCLVLLPETSALSRIAAKSGIKPEYQNTNETVKYVLMANTSHTNGELKLTHNDPN